MGSEPNALRSAPAVWPVCFGDLRWSVRFGGLRERMQSTIVSAAPKGTFAWRTISIFAFAVFATGGASTAFLLLYADAWPKSLQELFGLSAALLIVSAATFINLFLRWLRWHFLWRRLGVSVPTRKSALVFVAMLPAVLSPLAVAEVLVAIFMRRYSNDPWRLAFKTWLYSRLADAVALVLLIGLSSWLRDVVLAGTILVTGAVVLAGGFHVGGSRPFQRHAAGLLLYLSLSIAAWTAVGVGVWLGSFMIGHPIDLAVACSAFAYASLFGALTLIPGSVIAAGSLFLLDLQQVQMPLAEAVHLTLATRAGTVGLSVILGLSIWLWRNADLLDIIRARQSGAQTHFDSLSDTYDEEIPEHLRSRLLDRKIGMIVDTLKDAGIGPGARGFDLGCGQGWYTIALAQRGFTMAGGDLSKRQVEHARVNGKDQSVAIDWHVLDNSRLPVPDASLDFIYSINVLHHVIDPVAQNMLLEDVMRALRPGGMFILHEINTRNPFFRLYMSYLFPLLRNIDDGTERWLDPLNPPPVRCARWSGKPVFFTFLPDFTPQVAVRLLAPLERWLERSRLAFWSAHYQQILVRERSLRER
jgi:2-polyprenyl-3-methyl-5-hydroxy-6-metoxy-1,4-benzoquinol methylase